ncbi:hypothetical protein [Corynebacterium dentalis]|uniref:hypothetical protein n=1 Tax=Corynebacterium dentalis TaxID=2014528 RepID=UPI00289B55B7|nr:hypothetical protein [Corynebacterium dentalis]
MRFGTRIGIAGVVLIVLGPFINRNFGIGDYSSFVLPTAWESAPAAVLVSLIYLILLVLCILLSAALITTSLVIRHADTGEETTSTNGSAFRAH